MKQIAIFAWIPFVASDLGNFAGGFASGALVKRGMPVLRARKVICVVCCVPILAGIPAVLASSPFSCLAFICVALFGYAAWSTMGLTLPSDLFPPEVVGSVTGLSGLGAGLASTAFTLLVGTLVDRFSYFPAFVLAATAPLLATVSVVFLIRKSGRPEIITGLRSSFSDGLSRRALLKIASVCALAPRAVRADLPGFYYRDYSRCLPDYLSALARAAYENRNARSFAFDDARCN